MLGILGGTLVSFLMTAMSSSKNQNTCIVEDAILPSASSPAHLRIVTVTGEVTFANAAAIVTMGTGNPIPSRALPAPHARDVNYAIASLANTSETKAQGVTVGVQTRESQLGSLGNLSENMNICVCILDMSRVTLVDVDGADAIGTIGQSLARLTKKVREASKNSVAMTSQSHVYVVVGNEAPKNTYSDMWLKSKVDDGMAFRTIQGALHDWQESSQSTSAIGASTGMRETAYSALDFANIQIDGDFELENFSEEPMQFQFSERPSPVIAAMRNREGSFSDQMRARQGSFRL